MAGTRTSSSTEMLLPALDRDGGEPLHRQLERSLREAVRTGRLAPESTMPSTRVLAGELDVARGVVVEAYEQLIAEGYLASRPGGATRVARVPTDVVSADLADNTQTEFEFDLRPGRPELAEFPRAAWLRSLRRVLNEAPAARLGYLDGRGIGELRSALADYLNRVRGTSASAETTLISTGFAQGLQVVARAAARRRRAADRG